MTDSPDWALEDSTTFFHASNGLFWITASVIQMSEHNCQSQELLPTTSAKLFLGESSGDACEQH